jgi:hypothetical protein
MAIAIQDLRFSGHDLFIDNESYLQDLASDDDLNILGGATPSSVGTGTVFTGPVSVSISVAVSVIAVSVALWTLSSDE